MDDIDLYGDLDSVPSKSNSSDSAGDNQGDYGNHLNDLAILQDSHDRLQKENEVIAAELVQVKEQLARMVKINKILKSNISSLYKTAKAEMDRKNDRISEISRQFDNLVFRRRTNPLETDKKPSNP